MRNYFLLLALASGAAFADSPLFAPMTPSAPEKAREAEARKQAPSARAVQVNRTALESTVITVSVDGNSCRLVGAPSPAQADTLWSGHDGDDCAAHLIRDKTTGVVTGNLTVAKRHYFLGSSNGTSILTELRPSRSGYDEPTPELIERRRQLAAQRKAERNKR